MWRKGNLQTWDMKLNGSCPGKKTRQAMMVPMPRGSRKREKCEKDIKVGTTLVCVC